MTVAEEKEAKEGNGEQRAPDAAVSLVADKKSLLQQLLNVELKSRKQYPSDSLLLYFPNTAIRHLVNECFPNSYNALSLFGSHSDGYTSMNPNPPSNLKGHARDTNDNLQVVQRVRNSHVARESLIISSYICKTLYATIKTTTMVQVAKVLF